MLLTRIPANFLVMDFSLLLRLLCFGPIDIHLIDVAGVPNIGQFGDRRV